MTCVMESEKIFIQFMTVVTLVNIYNHQESIGTRILCVYIQGDRRSNRKDSIHYIYMCVCIYQSQSHIFSKDLDCKYYYLFQIDVKNIVIEEKATQNECCLHSIGEV